MNQTADETAETNEWDTTAESGANSTRGRTLIDSGSLDLMGTSDQTASLQNLEDLLTDEPYKRQDILTLQDPQDHSKFNLNAFHHIKNSLKLEDDDLERAKTDPKARLKRMNLETKEALAELEKTYKPTEMDVKPENKKEKVILI